ncbi:MAG: hypothetical protein U0354_21030 [Candidatus Sericytochromatia bacterium]
MTTNKNKKPDIVQAFDFYVDREYYKINKGFIFTSNILLRKDRMKEYKEWIIECKTMPDKILINGKEYKLNNI